MEGKGASINVGDHKIWEERSARLKALNWGNGTIQPESKYRVYLLLCNAMKEGNVDEFIEAVEKYYSEERVPLPNFINIQGPSGNSLLHVAAGIQKPDILQALLEFKHNNGLAGKVNYQGDTALHIAARAGRICTAEFLLGCTSVVDKPNDMGNTALHEAVKNRHYELTRLLLSRGSISVEMGDTKNLMLLMEAKDGRAEGMSPVHGAVIHQRIEMLKEMSERKKELFYLRDAENGTPLHLAASMNYDDIVKFLVNKFPSSAFEGDQNGYLPIHVACKMGHLEIIKKLLRFWPNPDELLNLRDGQNILHIAAKHGKDLIVDYILHDPKLEKLINAKDKQGNTPLHVAILHKQFKALLSFIGEDVVDLELVNNRNLTAFDIADEQRKDIDARRTAFRLLAVPLLKAAKAPRSKDKAICRPESFGLRRELEPLQLGRLKDSANTCMVVATLVAAMTFAAGFSTRGGYNGSEPDDRIAKSLNKSMYDVFVICNAIVMYSSIIAFVILLKTQSNEFRLVHYFLREARLPPLIAIATMSVAFTAGVYVIVSKRPWVAVVALIIGITSLFHIFRFYGYMFLWPLFYFLKLMARLAIFLPS
ncbi:hypothetical protein BT93_J1257 [Corymbia citriodora subsp. variegata]|nr:hypothetical protein BT93_J1257 [Corymbia citriodora subsp. variegata]